MSLLRPSELRRYQRGTFQASARIAHKLLDERDRNILIADFDTDDLLLVFARDERAAEARALLAPLFDRAPEAAS